MAVPTYEKFIDPLLRYLAAHPEGVFARDAHEVAADAFGLTDEQKQELIPSGQLTYKNRVGWAHDRLKRVGFSVSPRRGYWQLTEKGLEFARLHPAPLSVAQVQDLIRNSNDVRLRTPDTGESFVSLPKPEEDESRIKSPDDRLNEALTELRETVVADLLETLATVSPSFFERMVLDLLHRMGYGASRADLQRVGGSGDAGIDGIISLDKLGLEKVYVQAKRWQGSVGRPEIQAFYGALAGQRANKGVFITTSSYTPQAMEFARSVERIVLVDGTRLAALMIDHEVGVSARTIRVPKLDSDYFDEESV